jgi:hypothetical protein
MIELMGVVDVSMKIHPDMLGEDHLSADDTYGGEYVLKRGREKGGHSEKKGDKGKRKKGFQIVDINVKI